MWYFMRMNLAFPVRMSALLHLILAYPERFERAGLPCALLPFWEVALDDLRRNSLTRAS
jgi:hypothetical protein